jgi:predicted transcriptional regulator of viral defense system
MRKDVSSVLAGVTEGRYTDCMKTPLEGVVSEVLVGVIDMDIERLKKRFKKSNGVLKTVSLTEMKLDSRAIRNLVDDGILVRVRNGYYRLAGERQEDSDSTLIASLFPDAVVCMYSALFHWGYSDRTPLAWDLAVDKNTFRGRFDIPDLAIVPWFLTAESLSLGVTSGAFDGVSLRVFDRERVICDCLKYENRMERETFTKAIQGYIADPKKNVTNLLAYAKRRRVTDRIRDVLGVWL